MLINEAGKMTGLTKKAIEYYAEQGLVSPGISENGYRNFSQRDIEDLKKIAVYRRLDLSVEEIKAVLADQSRDALKKLSLQRDMKLQQQEAKGKLLERLAEGGDFDELDRSLQAIEQKASIIDRLLMAFPGYYGRFVCLHFSSFLKEPIITQSQRDAYEEIIAFLDNTPRLEIPEALQDFLIEGTEHMTTEAINEMMDNTKKSIENPEAFLSENKELLQQYLKYRLSEEYLNSPAHKLHSLLKSFNSTSGYYDVFIPAMRRLSPAYEDYSRQMAIANEKLLADFPEIAKL